MLLTEEKLGQRIKELEKYRYSRELSIPIHSFDFWIDEKAEIAALPPVDAEWGRISQGDRWKGWDLTAWLKADVIIPEEWAGKTVLGLFDIGKTGAGSTFGFESMLYINGIPYQGVDSNHLEVFLKPEVIGQKLELMLKVWSGIYGWTNDKIELEHTIKRSEVTVLEIDTDDLFFTASAAYQTVMILDENSWERQAILKALDRAFLLLNWRVPGDEAFYASVSEANNSLKQELAKLPKNNEVTVRCIGHTHIDVAWLWQLKHTREKAARSFSTVLRLMEKFPEYVFLQTQPQIYDDLSKDYPQIYEAIEERVKEGRWEAGGAMWLESDCNIPSGESLVRQLVYGMRYFEEKFDSKCEYLWLPDVFGYSWALPQILKKCGLKYFMTTKISWNVYNRFPHDTFTWRGIDGSEILTHYITTTEPGSRKNKFQMFYTYNGQILAETVKGIWDNYRDKEINDELLLSYGWGDGGGGPTRSMLEMRRRLEHMPGIPKVVTGRADEYFAKLGETVAETDRYVHRWDGELYLELHRGTYTSQAYNKKMNRAMENLLHNAELISTINSTVAGFAEYPQAKLYESWKIVLRNQFHDILPGSSITEVYEDCHVEYAEAEVLAEQALQGSMHSLASRIETNHSPSWMVFNTLSWVRDECIELPWEERFNGKAWQDAAGKTIQTERVQSNQSDILQLRVHEIPAYGFTTIHLVEASAVEPQKAAELAITVSNGKASTPFHEIEWNAAGQLTRLYDKLRQRETIAEGETANRLDVHEDKPAYHEVWEIDIFYYEKVRQIEDLQSVEVLENNSLRAVIRFTWHYGKTLIVQDMILYTHNPRIDFSTWVDWQERQQLLKVAFPVTVRATEATHEIQFGNVKRPTHWNTSWDYARFETCAHRWIDLSERGFGVSLLNDCKYGHDVLDNVMRITLIKSGIMPDPTADLGEHNFTYSLLTHDGDWFEAGTSEQAHRLNIPVIIAPIAEGSQQKTNELPRKVSFISCDADHVIIDTVKKAEDSDEWIVRCYEYAGQRGSVRFSTHFTIEELQEVNLMEREGIDLQHENNHFVASFLPFELKSFKIKIK